MASALIVFWSAELLAVYLVTLVWGDCPGIHRNSQGMTTGDIIRKELIFFLFATNEANLVSFWTIVPEEVV